MVFTRTGGTFHNASLQAFLPPNLPCCECKHCWLYGYWFSLQKQVTAWGVYPLTYSTSLSPSPPPSCRSLTLQNKRQPLQMPDSQGHGTRSKNWWRTWLQVFTEKFPDHIFQSWRTRCRKGGQRFHVEEVFPHIKITPLPTSADRKKYCDSIFFLTLQFYSFPALKSSHHGN